MKRALAFNTTDTFRFVDQPRGVLYMVMKHVIVGGCIALALPAALGQAGAATTPTSFSSANAPYVATMTFDVASVRVNKNIDPQVGVIMSANFVPHTTTFRATNWPIENLICNAYGVHNYQIVGAPKWGWTALFVIEAKGGSEADAKMAALTKERQQAEQQHMLRALLAERFNLKTHWETKEGDVYNLVVAKGGPKLSAEGSIPPTAEELGLFGDHPVPPLYQKNDGRGYDFIAHGYSTSELVRELAAQFGRPVIDKTGLTSKYDFVLKYRGRWDRDREADDLDPMPPLDLALGEQLGLKVEAAKGPVEVLVVDHVDKPSEN
jgi:uncharacterized protein (TIGR03435 family)